MNRGFTLIELLIATLVGAFTVLVAANVATVVVNQAAKGRQATDFNARARLVGRQMRNDIRLTGPGTTGAVTAANVPPWSSIIAAVGGTTPNGYDAFPVMVGINNAGAPAQPGSDVVMMLVANPAAQVQTIAVAPQSSVVLATNPSDPSPTAQLANWVGCSAVLIVDHSTPSGAGRAQIATLANYALGSVTLAGTDLLQFSVQPQSDIICARISTYWVSPDPNNPGIGGYLRRSDIPAAGGAITNVSNGTFTAVINDRGAADIIAPGIIDLQIAYAFSSEIYAAAPAYSVASAWAYYDPLGGGATINTFDDWFEVRQVRFTIHTRRLRAIDNFSAAGLGVIVPRAEDGGAFPDLPRSI